MKKKDVESQLHGVLATIADVDALPTALRYATLDGPRGALPVLQSIAAHPHLVAEPIALLPVIIQRLEAGLPAKDPARQRPRACEEPFGRFLVFAGREVAFDALAPRLVCAILRKYDQRDMALNQQPRPIEIPDPYMWSRAGQLLVKGASRLERAEWWDSPAELAGAAFRTLFDEEVGAQRSYLLDLARRALLLDVPTTVKRRETVRIDDLTIVPRRHPATTGVVPLEELVGAVGDGRLPSEEGLGTNDILGMSGRVTVTDEVVAHILVRIHDGLSSVEDAQHVALLRIASLMLTTGQTVDKLRKSLRGVPGDPAELASDEDLRECAQEFFELSHAIVGRPMRLNELATLGEQGLRSCGLSPVATSALTGRQPVSARVDAQYVDLPGRELYSRALDKRIDRLDEVVRVLSRGEKLHGPPLSFRSIVPTELVLDRCLGAQQRTSRAADRDVVKQIGMALGDALETARGSAAVDINWAYSVLTVMVAWGPRPSEAARLELRDVSASRQAVQCRAKSVYAIEERIFPYTPFLQELLGGFLWSAQHQELIKGRLFGCLSSSQLRRRFNEIVSRALPSAPPYVLYYYRHLCLTLRDGWARTGELPEWMLKRAVDGHSPFLFSDVAGYTHTELCKRADSYWRRLLPTLGITRKTRYLLG